MQGTRFAFGPAVPGTPPSQFSLWRLVLARTQVFSAWSMHSCCARSLFTIPSAWRTCAGFFEPHDTAKQFHEWRQQSTYLADTTLFEQIDVNLDGAGEWRRAHVVQASSNFFSVLGTQPVLGRGFAHGDDVDGRGWGRPGRNAVAVISYGLWQALFAGDVKPWAPRSG